jgi:lactam utilization protein B
MLDRMKKAHRLRAIQAERMQIEQWKLGYMQMQFTELEQQQEAVIAALNGESGLNDLFFDAHARRLARLAQAIAQLRLEREKQARRLLEETSRARIAANLCQRAARDLRRETERRELQVVVEEFAGRALQASGKIAGR